MFLVDAPRAKQIASDVAQYLVVLHAANVSLQPGAENFNVNEDGRAWCIDLDLAGEHNHGGLACGRPFYTAPEQWVDGGGLYVRRRERRVYTVRCAVCGVRSVLCALCSALCELCSAMCARCAVCCVPY